MTRVADDIDLETGLERHDLERAMADLPPSSQELLAARFLDEASRAELAARYGVSEGAVTKRLERGRLAMRRFLGAEPGEEAASYGLTGRPGDGWRETRIWCPQRGRGKLDGVADLPGRMLALRCPGCHDPDVPTARTARLDVFAGVRGFKPALNRLMA